MCFFTILLTAPRWCLVAALLVAMAPARAGDGPLVAVAANMATAMAAIAARFEAASGVPVRLSTGASGNLARQILRGAPFELFVSADEEYPRRVAQAGLARHPPVRYAEGHLDLVLAVPGAPSAGTAAGAGDDLRALLAGAGIRRLALANPEHAPYGRAARQVLEALGLWQVYRERLVLGESVAQAARFAATGAVQAAFLPRALAGEPVLAGMQRVPVPDTLHDPIHQHMVLLHPAGAGAAALYEFIRGDTARAILAAHGYAVPPRD